MRRWESKGGTWLKPGELSGESQLGNHEIATYERDSGKVLDDEIKIGTILLRLPESQLKTHLLM